MTAEELLRLPRGRCRYELVRGELRQYPLRGFQEGAIITTVVCGLAEYVREHGLGEVGASVGFVIHRNPDTVRAPAAAFVSRERLADIPGESYIPGPPDLAIEVVSFNSPEGELEERVANWLAVGTRLVNVLNPRKKSIAVFRPGQRVQVLRDGESLDGSDVVPGWSMPLARIFE